MSKLTLVIDNWSHKELEEYLLSLNGINNVSVQNDKQVVIDILYDDSIIDLNVIKEEIFLFIDANRVLSLIGFDKHFEKETTKEKLILKDICCEFCLKGTIEELFNNDGVEKIVTDFDDIYDREFNFEFTYDPNILSYEKLNKIIEEIMSI